VGLGKKSHAVPSIAQEPLGKTKPLAQCHLCRVHQILKRWHCRLSCSMWPCTAKCLFPMSLEPSAYHADKGPPPFRCLHQQVQTDKYMF
jgi:hypothetical protein